MINFKVIGFILGILLILEGFFMAITAPISIIYGDNDAIIILISAGVTILAGLTLRILFRKSNTNIGKREGYIIVSFGWIFFSIFGAIPFILTKQIPSFTDAFFETISGFTTTGASILHPEDYKILSHGMMFWRCMTQWLGGMGIIVLSILILPALGIGGYQLFVAEVPGPTPDKLHPRIKETAKRLWAIYLIFTCIEAILLWIGNMNLYEAICHSFTTMATGGYSTDPRNIEAFSSPFIQYVITLFMIIAGINFSLSYFGMHFKFGKVFKDEEFRFYLFFIGIFTLIIASILYITNNNSAEESFRFSIFQVVSIMTTTGFVTANYMLWVPVAIMLIMVLMFFGGSAGSTGSGLKIVRVTILFKNCLVELKRLIHPNAVIPTRLNGNAIPPNIVTNVLAFISFYILIVVISIIVISSMGYDLKTALGATAATLGNIGHGIGEVGPSFNYAHFPIFGKWFLLFLMLIGRLELFTVLVLFSPSFWKQ